MTAAVALPPRAFAHWDGGWEVEAGAFTVEAGRSSTDRRLTGTVTPAGAPTSPRPTR